MSDASFTGTIEVVRGRLSDERASPGPPRGRVDRSEDPVRRIPRGPAPGANRVLRGREDLRSSTTVAENDYKLDVRVRYFPGATAAEPPGRR